MIRVETRSFEGGLNIPLLVIPAQAGIQKARNWIPDQVRNDRLNML
jgi:hypothetical protein